MDQIKKTTQSELTALVTGAASGIGRATAVQFARMGVNVVVADLQSDGGMQTVQMIERMGGRSIFIECDVQDEDDVAKMIDLTGREFGRLDFAFNNAGVEGVQQVMSDLSELDWSRVIDQNLKSVWLCMKHELKMMIQAGHGSIVNCSSIAGLVGFQHSAAYVASKHGVIGLTRVAALEYAHSKIRVNAICPGVIRTPMVDRYFKEHPSERNAMVDRIPMGRFGTPEEIAETVAWLCSDSAAYVNGHALVADGGWTTQ
jgi:NAD(P)-dependent dehydrogenase (short-subunit alcohol dehydrogenase family)